MAEGGMYPLKPVFNLDASVDLPTCMYSLPVIQVSKSISGGAEGGDCPPAVLKALEARQEAILAKLGHIRNEVMQYRKSMGLPTETQASLASKGGVSSDIVVRCSPSHPPLSLPGLLSILSSQVKIYSSVHSHSSVSSLPAHLSTFLAAPVVERGVADLKVTLIWMEGSECEVMVSPISQSVIKGEVNLIRYMARLFPTLLSYESEKTATAVDNILDSVTSLLWAQPKDRQPILRPLAVNLGKSEFLCGASLGIADLALFSALKQLNLERDLQPELRKWFTQVSNKLMGGKGRRRSRASSSRKSGGAKPRKNSEKNKENVAPKKSGKQDKKAKDEKKAAKTPGKESGKTAVKAEQSPPPKSVTVSAHMSKAELLEYLTANGINYDNVDHPEVFTVDAMMPYVKHLDGAICKNLFLKDKQKNYYLLSAKHDREIKLNDLSKKVGVKDLRFGAEDDMFAMLGVRQGCVTAYALVNDKEKRVKFLVDTQLVDGSHGHVSFHPMVNTATTKISTEDFNKFLSLTKHNVIKF